jgi:hypothetical protein
MNKISNKFVEYVKSIAIDKKKMSKENRKLYDEATSLFVNRKIAQKRSLDSIINGLVLNKDVEKIKAKILKFISNNPIVGIKQAGSVYVKKSKPLKNFHILVDVVTEVQYESGKKRKL